MDLRENDFPEKFLQIFQRLRKEGFHFKVVFLETSDIHGGSTMWRRSLSKARRREEGTNALPVNLI